MCFSKEIDINYQQNEWTSNLDLTALKLNLKNGFQS